MNQSYPKVEGKKIVMLVVNDFTHDSRVLKEAISAKSANMDVYVLARKSKDTLFEEEKDGIKIIRVQTFLDKMWQKASNSGGREVSGSQSAGMPRGLAVYAGVLNTHFINKQFVKLIKKIKPDLVHANDTTALGAGLASKKMGIPVVYDAHELYTEQLENPNYIWSAYFKSLEKKLPKIDAIFSVNQSILDEIDQRYATDKIPKAILYNAPYHEEHHLRKADKNIKLLYLGHYAPGRGLEALFEAVKMLPDVTLTTYGNGFSESQSEQIIHMNPVKPSEVVSVAKDFDIGILPYVGDTLNNLYSTPNKLFEYMIAGLALAASDLPEIRRVIENAGNGVLFDPKNPADMAQKIRELCEDRQKLQQLKQNSLNAAKDYAWENQAKKQLDIYNKIVS